MSPIEVQALQFIDEQPGLSPTDLSRRFRYETEFEIDSWRGVATRLCGRGLITIGHNFELNRVQESK